MLQTTSKFQIILALVLCSSLCELYQVSALPDSSRYSNQISRMRRFGQFQNIAGPAVIDRCIMACAMCSPEEPSYLNDVSILSFFYSNNKIFKIIFFKKKDLGNPVEVACANHCLMLKSFYDVLVELLQNGADKKFVKCFFESSKSHLYY